MAPLELTRRELLAAFLGAPALASLACRGVQPPPLPPGEIVGASDRLGHRLREADGATWAPPERWERAQVVIVGGGVAGLSAAWRLRRAGLDDFALLELEAAPGGTARSGESPVVAYPWGAHYIVAPMPEQKGLIALLDEMGVLEGRTADGAPVVAEQFLCRAPEERVHYKGRWYDGLYLHAGASAEDRRQLAAFEREIDRWVAWRDARGRRAFAIPTARGSDDAEVAALDRVRAVDWLDERGFTSPRLRWYVEYGCRDDYGSTLATTSAWAMLFYFASRIARVGAESQPLVTWPEGNGRLVAHLARAAGDRVKLGLTVVDVAPASGGAQVIALDAAGDSIGFAAERVIFAAPQFVAARAIRPWRDSPPLHAGEFQYGAWMVANLHLHDRPASPEAPLAWDNVIYESPSLGYVVATHQRGLDHGPTVFTYYYPLVDEDPRAARERLLATGRDAWAEIALADLERPHRELRRLCTRLDVARWGHAMIRPRPGFQFGPARKNAARPLGAIHFAHSDLSGIALFEEAFDQGVRAAEEVLGARGLPVDSLR